MDLGIVLSSDAGGSAPVCRGALAKSCSSLDVESVDVSNVRTELASLCLAEIEMTDDRLEGDEAEEPEADVDDAAKEICDKEFGLLSPFAFGSFGLCIFPRPPRPE